MESQPTPTRPLRGALIASGLWTVAGLAFTPVMLWTAGASDAGHYLSVFVLEKTLSLDNVAMFAAILGAARLPSRTAARVLTGGLLAALVLRIVFIAAGIAIVDAAHSLLLGFAVVLVVSGVQMARADEPTAPRKPSRWTPEAVRRRPALVALISIAVVDVAFAADSILAAFAVTTSALPIIAANVFAVLGLRPLYVVLSDAMDRFRFLRSGIAVLLVLIGVELAVEHFVEVPSWATLAVVGCCLGGAVLASMIDSRGITMRSALRRTTITVTGFALLAAGAAMLVLPGPGLLVIVMGLAVLAKEYVWARKPLDAMRRRLDRIRKRNVTQKP